MSATWLAPEAARPLAWWDEAALRTLGTTLDAVVAAWRADWGSAAQGSQSVCTAVTSAWVPEDGWQALLNAAGQADAWLQVEENAAQRMVACLFGTGPTGAMAHGVAKACLADGIERMARSLSLEPDAGIRSPFPQAAVLPWSGAVVVELAGEFTARLVIGGDAARRWQQRLTPCKGVAMAAAVPLTAAVAALACQPLTFAVHLEGCELTLGAVQDLQVGDVVRIGHLLEEPAQVADATGTRTFSAYLGRQGSHKAVELVRSAP